MNARGELARTSISEGFRRKNEIQLVQSFLVTGGSLLIDATVSAAALPLGTVIWSNPGNGSGVSTIVPAVIEQQPDTGCGGGDRPE